MNISSFNQLIGDHGLYVPHIGDTTSSNGVLYTTEYYLILKRLGLLTQEDKDKYTSLIEQCLSPGGLFYRMPGDTSQDSPDDLIALAVGSKAFGCGFAERVLKYGKTTFPHYIYNQTNPGQFTWSAYMGRQIGLIGFLKMCAGYKPNMLEKLALYVGIYLTSRQPKEETTDKLLTQLIVEQMPDSIITRYWNNYITKTYGGIGGVTSVYFGADNPFALYWR